MNSQGTLERIRKIGSGTEGRIDLLRSSRSGKLFALKRCKPDSYIMSGRKPREVRILLDQVHHLNIVRMHGYRMMESPSGNGENLLMFFDYYAGGDLNCYSSGRTNQKFLLHVFRQMAAAIAYLHTGYCVINDAWAANWKRVVHCDIRPGNIFLKTPRTAEDPLPEVVLGDFGFANTDRHGEVCGDRFYQPPELPMTSASGDVWSLGATIYHMAHGRPPLDDMPRGFRGEKREWLRLPRARNPRELPSMYSSLLNGIVMDCLEIDPRDRIKSIELAEELRRAR